MREGEPLLPRAAIALPSAITLPSGSRVTLDVAELARRAPEVQDKPELAAAVELLETPGVIRDEEGPRALAELALVDVHLLVALCARAGLVPEAEREHACENCGARLSFVSSFGFEPGPFVDGELDDAELDARFDFTRPVAMPTLFTGSGVARSLVLAPRTLGQARMLYGGRPLRVTRGLVAALGIEAIGRERRADVIVRTLGRASEEAWAALGDAWEDAHYSPRMFASARCACGARVDVPVPAARPFDAIAPPVAGDVDTGPQQGFMSLDAFEKTAERARRAIYAKKGVRNVALVIETGVPDCDDGGEPLLGSYTPPAGEGEQPEIRLYYRTFQSELRFDPSFDVEAEIHETIEHEVEHHLYFLSGHDPMDEEERVVIARERQRVVGRSELERRTRRGLGPEIVRFLRVMAPLLVLLFALLMLELFLR